MLAVFFLRVVEEVVIEKEPFLIFLEDEKISKEMEAFNKCLIIDDICDGGGTFIGLAKELKQKNAGDLYLAVSHGIFSKGLEALNTYFTKLYTTDSFKTLEDGVKQINLSGLIKWVF